MTKHVYPNYELAHVWAHDWARIGNGRNAGDSFYFQQNTIYSYGPHFPIATIMPDHTHCHGGQVVMFTREGYSNTTAKHINHVSGAVSHMLRFDVPNLNPETPAQHYENWQALRSDLNEVRNTINNSRKLSDYLVEHADRAAAKANKYAEVFGLTDRLESTEYPLVALNSKQRAEITAKIELHKVEEERRNAEAQRRLAEEAAKREEQQAQLRKQQARLNLLERISFGLYKAPSLLGYQSGLNRSAKKPRSEQQEIERKAKDWQRNGGRFPYGYNGPVLMRVDQIHGEVITSKGARFPTKDCRMLWPEIVACVKTRQQRNRADLITKKLGVYGVDYIAPNGDIKAGCHYVTYEQARRLAIILGLEKPTMREKAAYKLKKLL